MSQDEKKDEGMTKLGVSCGGPEKPKPSGTKEASADCGDCGTKHDAEPSKDS